MIIRQPKPQSEPIAYRADQLPPGTVVRHKNDTLTGLAIVAEVRPPGDSGPHRKTVVYLDVGRETAEPHSQPCWVKAEAYAVLGKPE